MAARPAPSRARPGPLSIASTREILTRTLVAACATTGTAHLAGVTLNTLLPFHVVALGGSNTEVGLVFSVMTVVSMILRPLVGGWVDRLGAPRVLLPGIAALAAVSLALHLAATPAAVIALMVGLGLSNGLITTTTSVLAAASTGPERRGEALGLYYLAGSLTIAAGPPLAFWLRDVGGIPLGFAVVTALAVTMVATVQLLPAAARVPVAGARPRFAMFSRHAVPAGVAIALLTIGHNSMYAFLPLYAVSQGHESTVVWFFAIQSAWLIAVRAALRGLSDRIGRAPVAAPAMLCVTLAFFVLALPPSVPSLVAAALLLGSGNALLYPTVAALVVDRAPEGERGLALGTISAAWDLGVVVGSAITGVVVDRVSYGAGFVLAGVAATLGLLTFVLTERRRLPERWGRTP